MLKNGTIVEVFEDPLTMKRKEGNARIVEFLFELEPGLNQYLVEFISDGFVIERRIAEKPFCTCLKQAGDDENCRVHGKVMSHVATN